MAKKKKVKSVNIEESSSLNYSGNITIKKVKNGKVTGEYKQHNAGTKYFFEFLLSCLGGNYAESLRPLWITTCKKGLGESSNEIYYNYVSNVARPILSTKKSTLTDDNCYIEYKFYLPYKKEYRSSGFDTVLLYNTENKPDNIVVGEAASSNYSMIVSFDETITASEDEDLLVVWQLKIKN